MAHAAACAICILREIDRVTFQIGELAELQRAFMRRPQHDARRAVCLQCLLPARRAQAPAITGLQSCKTESRGRRRKIIALRFRKTKKLLRHDDAYRMAAEIVRPGIAATVTKESGHGFVRAGLQRSTKNVA